MTASDREFIRGWQAAMKGETDDPFGSDRWREGYRIGLATLAKKRAA